MVSSGAFETRISQMVSGLPNVCLANQVGGFNLIKNMTLALKLALDQAVQSFLVAFDRQEHIGRPPWRGTSEKGFRGVKSIRLN